MATDLHRHLEAIAASFVSAVLAAVRGASMAELVGRPARPYARTRPLPDPPKEFDALIDGARHAFARQRTAEADLAYHLTVLARAAGSGRNTALCARALGISRQTLSPYALVGSQWTASELEALLANRRNVHGDPISISHLVLLARVPATDRDRWLERTFENGLTVRELRRQLKGHGL